MFRIRIQVRGMRKPDDCVVYPRQADAPHAIIFQGRRTIGKVDARTGDGLINYRGSQPKYFVHLSPVLGAVPCQLPMSFIRQLEEFRPNAGDLIGASPETGPVYIAPDN